MAYKRRNQHLAERNTTHGLSLDENGNKSRLYGIWVRMRQRCSDKNSTDYHRYGGRGISVCHDWSDFKQFHDWAMAHGYEEHLTIERVDVDGNYEPVNCKWVTRTEQSRNKSNNHLVSFRGDTMTLAEWEQVTGISSSTIRQRLGRGWNVERALTTPVAPSMRGRWSRENRVKKLNVN
ncbi:hypothetical protein [Alicyclobacillus sp. SO9]|uniref:hypothetical protein n=1 Tax=Alicyclobacillus sp. SO9 TaxID=2665646 RepID=UPI0018E8101C|nr:hypothetical protein [Alicyclobacillus sp. SO9]QQE80889.1 hypothetical protein GI364_11190 [Alicyclobacillus sp. SO9]